MILICSLLRWHLGLILSKSCQPSGAVSPYLPIPTDTAAHPATGTMSCANVVGSQFLSKQWHFTYFFRGADVFQDEKSVAEFLFSSVSLICIHLIPTTASTLPAFNFMHLVMNKCSFATSWISRLPEFRALITDYQEVVYFNLHFLCRASKAVSQCCLCPAVICICTEHLK